MAANSNKIKKHIKILENDEGKWRFSVNNV